jgi:glutaredoxin 3
MYTTGACPYCQMAERLLASKGVAEIDKIRVDLEPARRVEMMEVTGRRTVPQIYIGETHVGGYDELAALERAGKLDELLRA